MWKKIGATIFWLILLGATFSYGKLQGGDVSWFLFYACLALGLYEILTASFAMRESSSRRRLSSHKLTAGQALTVDVLVEVEGKWPLPYAVVEDELPTRLLLQSGMNRELHFPGFRRKMRLQYTLLNMPRGKYALGNTRILTGDLFGIVKKSVVHEHYDEITVYPRVIPIKFWHTVNKFNTGNTYAQNRKAEDSANVIGVRDYVAGDRLSRIHWRASARTGQLKTKEFELHVTNDLMFFLNRSERAFQGASNQLFELAVTACASLTKYAISKKYSVGLVSYGRERVTIPQSRSIEQYMRIIEHLALVQPDGDHEFLETLLREVNYIGRGSTVVLFTPVIDEQLVGGVGFLEYRKIKTEMFFIIGGRKVTEEEQALISKLSTYGANTYIIRDENELDDAVRGPMSYASNN